MMVNTTIYGYVTDGGAYHVMCTTRRPDGDHDDVSALYYLHDEDPHGLSCDQCREYIFEPMERHAFQPVTPDSLNCRECDSDSYCSEGPECWLHIQPDVEPVIEPDTYMGAALEQLRLKWADRPDWTH
jgi:hypothetical protein